MFLLESPDFFVGNDKSIKALYVSAFRSRRHPKTENRKAHHQTLSMYAVVGIIGHKNNADAPTHYVAICVVCTPPSIVNTAVTFHHRSAALAHPRPRTAAPLSDYL